MYRRLAKQLEELGYSTLVYQDSLYAEKGLLIVIINKVNHQWYRVECIDSGNDITFVSRVKSAKQVLECVEQQREYFVL